MCLEIKSLHRADICVPGILSVGMVVLPADVQLVMPHAGQAPHQELTGVPAQDQVRQLGENYATHRITESGRFSGTGNHSFRRSSG